MRLIDGDALLRKICGDSCGCEPDQCGYLDEYRHYRCKAGQYVENAPTVNQWISVKDRLPDEDGRYLTYHGQSQMKQAFGLTGVDLISISTWSKQRGSWWSIEYNRPIIGITYWKFLAEPPKEDDDGE